MTSRKRYGWALGWLAVAAFAGFVISLRYLESRYHLLITDEQLRFERPWAALLLLAAPLAWLSRVWIQRAGAPWRMRSWGMRSGACASRRPRCSPSTGGGGSRHGRPR